jgi:hypothetical protein
MATYQFSFYEFQDFTITGGAGSTGETQWLTSGTFTLSGSAAPIQIVVDDNEGFFHDGFQDPNVNGPPSSANNDQVLTQPITVNGITYPAGTQIELEFAVSTNSTEGNQIVFYYIRINGVNVGIAGGSADVVPGVTYTITGGQDGNGDTNGTFHAWHADRHARRPAPDRGAGRRRSGHHAGQWLARAPLDWQPHGVAA